MLLGFDATTIRGNMTGVGYYSARLLERLTRVGGETNPIDEVLVLSNREQTLQAIPRGREVEIGRFPLRAVWMQGILPFVLRHIQPDLCHFTNFLAPYCTNVPYVVTVHDMTLELLPRYHTWRKRALTKTLSPGIARRARFIITPSESARADVARVFGIDPKRVRAIAHAPDPRFAPTRDAASAERIRRRYGIIGPYLLYVGTLEPRKNLVRAVRAFKRISEYFPEHRFYLAGELGWQSKELLQTIGSLGMEDRVVRLGYVEEADLPAIYSHASLFVYPSLYEGFGFPVVEAMACGVPVLTSKTSSLIELARDAAITANPFDERELAESMDRGLSDVGERRRLERAGPERARSFTWQRTVQQTLEVYKEALERVTVRPERSSATLPAKARAIRDTLAYGAVFDYPMTLTEIHRSLMQVTASRREIARLLRNDPVLRTEIGGDGRYYFLRGEEASIEARQDAQRRTRALLAKNRRAIAAVRRVPFVRMVALSGATAHENARDDDIDLFIITARGSTWTVALTCFVMMKAMGLRRTLCLNYFVGADRIALAERDAFTASQVVGLKPLAGHSQYLKFVRANPWGSRFFPNFWRAASSLTSADETEHDEPGWLLMETVLSPIRALVERASRRILGWHLARHFQRAGAPSTVKLEPDLIKLHFNDHGLSLGRRIDSIRSTRTLRKERSPLRPGETREPGHARTL